MMQEIMSMVMPQKCRKPMMLVRLRLTMRTTMKQTGTLHSSRKVTMMTAVIDRPRFRHNSDPMIMSVSQEAYI